MLVTIKSVPQVSAHVMARVGQHCTQARACMAFTRAAFVTALQGMSDTTDQGGKTHLVLMLVPVTNRRNRRNRSSPAFTICMQAHSSTR